MYDRPDRIDMPRRLLGGPRIDLRAWDPEDASELQAAITANRAHLDPWMPWTASYDEPGAATAFIAYDLETWDAGSGFQYGIRDRASGRLIGGTSLDRIDPVVRRIEVGYWLSAEATGKGFATEAAHLMTTEAIEVLRLERVEIRCDPRNMPSRAVAERLGYALECTIIDDILDPSGEMRDTLVLVMTPARWRALNP